MLRLLVEYWSEVPQWLRVAIGLQIVAAGWMMHVLAHRVAAGSDGPAGFTIGLGMAVAGLALRSGFRDNGAADNDGE